MRQQTTISINEAEEIRITGDYNDFTFDYYIYSEVFETWVKQDIEALKVYASSWDKLMRRVENHLLKVGA